ncbi:MAG: endonuclease domain-containing protein, partial [Actinomycetota bacterium]|nr:endonuclease domain-containing protein [Actinomycetota bacterium]
YGLGEGPVSQETRWLAAVLAHPGCAISHRTATALWGLEAPRGAIEIVGIHQQRLRTRPRPSYELNPPRLKDPLLHGTRRLPAEDLTTHLGIPVTSVPRTILDSAATATAAQLEDLVDEAFVKRLLRERDLVSMLDRTSGRKGGAKLKGVIGDMLAQDGETRSGLERKMLRLCAKYGIQPPLTNQIVCGIEVDCYWPEHKLIIEVDGRSFHQASRNFEEDRERDAYLGRHGFRVLRLTWKMIVRKPDETARKIRAYLELTRPAAAGRA